MILVIDNYDSFVYNLVQYLGEMGQRLEVFRNDKLSLSDIAKLAPEKIIISPGPGRPEDAGISCSLIKKFARKIPILGVCLGHQCIGYAFAGEVVRAERIMHGKTSLIYHNQKGIFAGITNPFEATRYHSLIVKADNLPECLEITAQTDRKEIMGIKHKDYSIWGVQFHPESILTKEGKKLLRNFLEME
jgi:anthranilate synthase/aminodeoxychorismate synthase-like glutamine amidotransferase